MLLAAVARASSAAASEANEGKEQRSLDGRQFEVRIRFGCEGPASELARATLGWTFDPESRTLRVRAVPTISREDPIAARVASDAVEAIEGFWIPRPWLLGAACPVAATDGASRLPAPPARPASGPHPDSRPKAQPPAAPAFRSTRVGLAEFHSAAGPRTLRRQHRAFEAVEVLDSTLRPEAGFNLVLAGRLRAIGGKAIHCFPEAPDVPPDCLVSVRFDRVRVEWPGSGNVIAEWSGA